MAIKVQYKIHYPKKGLEFFSDKPLSYHETVYLKTFDGPEKDLYEAMRHYGVDWFVEERIERIVRGGKTYDRTPDHNRYMSEIQKALWSTINRKGRPHYKCLKQEWPAEGFWRVINSNGLHYVQNLKKWCKANGYDYHKVRGKYRYGSFPYGDIEQIVREK